LATGGMRLTHFYNAARCCPSRASLLTGLYPHQAGVGWMEKDLGHPQYRGFIKDNAATIAEILRPEGYRTYQVGKWHVGNDSAYWPHRKGFEQHFTFVNGAGSYYNLWPYRAGQDSMKMAYNGKRWRPGPDYYATDAFSDSAAAFIQRHNPDEPFFMYLAYTAPHWPLHVPQEDLDRYRGQYRMGWDQLRKQRYARMREIGILPAEVPLSPRFSRVVPWDSVSQEAQDEWDLKMALYAAVVDRMDQGIGRVVDVLTRKGILDETLIIFLSDNGGSPERMPGRNSPYPTDGPPGSERSFPSYDPPWANASNTPYRFFKAWLQEGGMATPFIAHYPELIAPGQINQETVGHIMDLMATSLDLAGISYPDNLEGRPLTPSPGRSLVPAFRGEKDPGHPRLFWEHQGNRAVRQGAWKLVANNRKENGERSRQWALFNLEDDPAELRDVSTDYPGLVAELSAAYTQWASQNGILSPEEFDALRRK
jgi:arylsulfatase A-like enzyme